MDLATDVTDEIKRRQAANPDVPFLPLSDLYLPKRNQARQKLATLPAPKFKELATDILFDLERRFPSVSGGGTRGDDERSMQSPNPPLSGNDEVTGFTVPTVANGNGISPETVERLRIEYENRIEALQTRMVQMEKEYRFSKEEQQRSFDIMISEQSAKYQDLEVAHNKLRGEYDALQTKYSALSDDFANQQQIARDIRTEATNLLNEIKSLTTRNEELTSQVRQMQAQGIAVPSVQTSVVSASAANEAAGVVETSRIQAYYDAVDALLKASTSKTPTSVLVAMKAVVISCKNITEDAELYESSHPIPQNVRDALESTKNQLSMRLTELMAAAKSHATNQNSQTPAVFEAAVKALTATVNGLVAELNDTAVLFSDGTSVGNGATAMGLDINGLKEYLERQTDQIVQSIQWLLNSMRQTQISGQEFVDTVAQITTTVSAICRESQATLAKPSCTAIRTRGNELVSELLNANGKIGDLGNQLVLSPTSKALKQKMASSSYEIAKFVKDLIALIEQ
ncbi:component of the polarisome [Entophlyctis sp. JEL0112]|nr:component of the polarisome [Entophlyctis sp. JEL0112]